MTSCVAYLINQYPSVSHTFIRREIRALERRGWTVQRIALRGWDLPLVDALDLAERDRTRYVLKGGSASLLASLLRSACRSPRRFIAALRLAWQMAGDSQRAWPVHLAYLAQACRVHEWTAESGARPPLPPLPPNPPASPTRHPAPPPTPLSVT